MQAVPLQVKHRLSGCWLTSTSVCRIQNDSPGPHRQTDSDRTVGALALISSSAAGQALRHVSKAAKRSIMHARSPFCILVGCLHQMPQPGPRTASIVLTSELDAKQSAVSFQSQRMEQHSWGKTHEQVPCNLHASAHTQAGDSSLRISVLQPDGCQHLPAVRHGSTCVLHQEGRTAVRHGG